VAIPDLCTFVLVASGLTPPLVVAAPPVVADVDVSASAFAPGRARPATQIAAQAKAVQAKAASRADRAADVFQQVIRIYGFRGAYGVS
jgi:hypothetical protein